VLTLTPITQAEARAFIAQHHRHHKPSVGSVFQVAVADEEGAVRGVAMVGRPVARMLNDGWTLEVTRVATDGAPNACSMLYGAAWRAARAMGYKRIVTYILDTEPGTSLKAAGYRCVGEAGGGRWSRTDRPRVDTHPLQTKMRWERTEGVALRGER